MKFISILLLLVSILCAESYSVQDAGKRTIHQQRTLQVGLGGSYSFTNDGHLGAEIQLLKKVPLRSHRSKNGIYFGALFGTTFTPETEEFKMRPIYDIGILVGGRYLQGGAGLLVKKVETKGDGAERETKHGFQVGPRLVLPLENPFTFSVSPKFAWVDDEFFFSGTLAIVFQFNGARFEKYRVN